MNATELNVTGLDTTEKQEKIMSAFESLSPDSSLHIQDTTTLQPLLPMCQDKFWGELDWHPLENGPSRWQVVLHRQPRPLKARGLAEFMTYDHHRCDELYAAMENAAQAGDLATTEPLFKAFETGMAHHFNMEETKFFPAFEEATGMTQGPTMVMRMEHRQMLGVIGQMRQAMENKDLSGLIRGGTTLMVLMRQHNIKEEQMLYPMGEMHLGDVAQLLKTMQAL